MLRPNDDDMNRENRFVCRKCEKDTDNLAQTLILPNYVVIPLHGLCIECAKVVREQLIAQAHRVESAKRN